MTIISGIGVFTPKLVQDQVYIEKYGTKAKTVARFINHHEHFSATDPISGELLYTNLNMAENAASQAIKNANLKAEDIDMIIYSSCTPDFLLPPSFARLQEKLGIKKCMGFDIRSGCAGFGSALTIADTYICAGKAKNVLVIGVDLVSSRFTNLNLEKYTLKHIFNHMFFGDCAGAVILSASSQENRGIFYTEMSSTRANADFGSIFKIGGAIHPYIDKEIPEEQWAVHQTAELSEIYLAEVLIEELNNVKNKISLEELDLLVMPVESGKIKKQFFSAFPELNPEKIISGGECGALINAAVPYALYKAQENNLLKSGAKILIYAAENTKWQHAMLLMNW